MHTCIHTTTTTTTITTIGINTAFQRDWAWCKQYTWADDGALAISQIAKEADIMITSSNKSHPPLFGFSSMNAHTSLILYLLHVYSRNPFPFPRKIHWKTSYMNSISLESELGRCANNQNGNLSWHLPWRGGGPEGVSSATYVFWNMIFLKPFM